MASWDVRNLEVSVKRLTNITNLEAKAMEIGEIQGAMSSLSSVVSGLLTVLGAMIFSNFI